MNPLRARSSPEGLGVRTGTGSVPERRTILSADTVVEQVTRAVVLKKKPGAEPTLRSLLATVRGTGAHLLARIKSNLFCTPIRVLGDGSYLAKLSRAITLSPPRDMPRRSSCAVERYCP